MSTRIKRTGRRGRRGRLLSRPRLSAVVCLYLLLLQVSPACAFQQRPRTTAAPPAAPPAAATVTGVGPWADGVADLVRFPSEEAAFIAGPQLKAASALNPAPWFDSNASAKGLQYGAAFPAEPPFRPITGAVTVAAGSKTVKGTGTKFTTELRPGNEDYFIIKGPKGGRFVYLVTTIESDTALTLNLPAPAGAAGANLAAGTMKADEGIAYENFNYYDQAQVQYINYYRTGDARFLAYARKVADSWWLSGPINEGRTHAEESTSPRTVGLGGLMLRALDGRPEMWPWITDYTRTQFHLWVERPLNWNRKLSDAQLRGAAPREEAGATVKEPAGFYFGVRDGGYMLLHAANLARVHPDPAVRSDLKTRVLAAAVEYYGRLQALQGDGGFYFYLRENGLIGLTTQPFQEGILGEGLVAVHRLTGDERVKASIVKLAEHLYLKAFNPADPINAPYYFVGGKFANGHSCEQGCGAAANASPPPDQIAEARQLAPTQAHVFGYAYSLTGDSKFVRWGDEVFGAAFGSLDAHRALCAFRQKEYGECYRSAGKYLAWRLAHGNVRPGARPAAADTPTGAADTSAPPAGASAAPADTSAAAAPSTVAAPEGPRALVSAAQAEALRLSSGGSLSADALRALLEQIEGARRAVAAESVRLVTPAAVLKELVAAAEHAQTALRMVTAPGGAGGEAALRLDWAAARLKRAGDRLRLRDEQ